jgi:hypothetical protein
LKVETLRKMTLYKRKSSTDQNFRIRLRNEPYIFVNIFFTGVILLIIIYSGIFSADKGNYPVACLHEKLTGEPCISCGLSHSFSLIVRGRLNEAFQWNQYGLRVFLFFVLQLLMRVVFSILYLKYKNLGKQLIIFDISGSVLMFLIAFYPFIFQIFKDIF